MINLEVTQKMRDDIVLHNWKMMQIDRCRVTWGRLDNFRFPNGISLHMGFGRKPFKIGADAERAEEVEILIQNMEYTKKTKMGQVEYSVPFENRGRYLDLLWGLYSIGRAFEI